MLAAAVLMLALADPQSPTPPHAALVSPVESARYALTHGCLASVRDGVRLAERPNHFLRLTDEKKGLYRMVGAGTVETADHPGPVCYLSVRQGDATALRAMALELLAAEGPVRTLHDAPIEAPDHKATFREERFCIQLGGRPVFALMPSGQARMRRPLQLTLAADAHAAACLAVKAP